MGGRAGRPGREGESRTQAAPLQLPPRPTTGWGTQVPGAGGGRRGGEPRTSLVRSGSAWEPIRESNVNLSECAAHHKGADYYIPVNMPVVNNVLVSDLIVEVVDCVACHAS